MRRKIDWWALAEALAILALTGCLTALALVSRSRATGITNMLLGAGGSNQFSTTVTAGTNVVSGNGEIGYCVTASGVCASAIGSLSASSIPGSYTIEAIEDLLVSGSVTTAYVVIDGFSSSPGAAWLGDVTFNSETFVGSSATYTYSAGTATWKWTTATGWAFVSTDVYPGTVQYQ